VGLAGAHRGCTPPPPTDVVARLDEMLRSQPVDGYAACCEALAALDLRGQLGGVRVPALTIAGDDDPVTPPAKLEAIRAEITGARDAVIPGARHLTNAEHPGFFTHV